MTQTPSNLPLEQNPESGDSKDNQSPRLDGFLRGMASAEASDLHLKPGSVPHIRVGSVLRPTRGKPISPGETDAMIDEILSPKQKAQYEKTGSLDLAREPKGSDRFRLNIYRQRGDTAIAARRVTRDIPEFETLHLPEVVMQIAKEHQGLILVSGPTGCGKSTTIASMLEYINRTRQCHIVTIEDPIEYIFDDKKALVNQREIGIDVEDYTDALKYLSREDPDTVLIGEMRDHETFQAALRVSETGHLVFATVHASSASQTVSRLLDLFPQEERHLVRQSLSNNLRAIICQRLLPSILEGVSRIPAVEVMLRNPTICKLIEEEREGDLADVIRSNERAGMQSFTKSLMDLIENEYVDPKVAFEAAPNVDELKMLMKGITTSRSGLLG